MTDKVVVLSTCASPEEARRLARAVIDKRLAACVTILPGATSVYRWQGNVEEAQETLLLIKSSRSLLDALQAELEQVHSYELPEFVALPIIDGSERYMDWLEREISQGG